MNRIWDTFDLVRNSLRGRGVRALCRDHGLNVAAIAVAMSLLAAIVLGGAQSAVASTPADLPIPGMGSSSSSSTQQNPNQFQASVEKVVTVAANSAGTPQTTSVWAQTSATGSGSTTATVPVGTSSPVNLTSFSPLTTQGDSIVYPLSTEGAQVSQDVANAGQFTGDMPVAVEIDLKVNGQTVDPNTATNLTGNVELTYNLINKTVSNETLSFKDANGNVQTKELPVAVPFSASYSATFDNGWSNIQAPWAQSGFSTGLTVTGSATLKPTMLNKYDPNAQWKLTATVENAALPAATIKFQPQSSSGDTTVDGAGQELAKVTQMIEGAGSMLTKVQAAIGKGSTELDKILKTKVDPVLNMISKLNVDPAKLQAMLTTGGDDLTEAGDYLLLINEYLYQYTAKATTVIANATNSNSQQELTQIAEMMSFVELYVDSIITQIASYVKELKSASVFLTGNVPSTFASYICPGGASSCTWQDALEGLTTNALVPTCTKGQATQQTLNTSYGAKTALEWVKDSAYFTHLGGFKTQLEALSNATEPTNCVNVSGSVATDINRMMGSISLMTDTMSDLMDVLTAINKDLDYVQAAMLQIVKAMPAINANMRQATPLLVSTAAKDKAAKELFDSGVREIIRELRPVVGKVARTINLLGAAAIPLENRINELPGLIDQLGYGTLGFFIGEVDDIGEVGNELTVAANQMAAMTTATDKKFYTGVGLPYGFATGSDVQTSGSFIFHIASAEQSEQKTAPTLIFAIVMLIGAAGASVWLTRRSA